MSLLEKITGRDITRARCKNLKLTQKQFTKLLSQKTGLELSTKTVVRYESYGRKDAASPEKPPMAVRAFVYRHPTSKSLNRLLNGDKGMLTENQVKAISEAAIQYREMGIEDVDAETAVDTISAIKAKLRSDEVELLGEKFAEGSSPEARSLEESLRDIEEEEAELDKELEWLKAELNKEQPQNSTNKYSTNK